MPGTLYTLGYAKCRDVPSFTALLDGHHIDLLFDVRFMPTSRNPLWRSPQTTEVTVLRSGLVGTYRWEKGLGNPDYRSGKPATGYADPSVIEDVLAPLVAGESVGLMCYCPTTAKCHRRLIVADVVSRIPGVDVVQLELTEDPR